MSPLIALMRDQVRALSAAGVAAGSLNSNNEPAENARVLDLLRRRELRLLYLAPERLARPDTVEMLAESDVTLWRSTRRIASRNGATISGRSTWRSATSAPDRRPPESLALTATADTPTRGDIVDKLFPAPPRVFIRSFDRPNLRLAFKPKERSARQVLGFVAIMTAKAASSIAPRAARSRNSPPPHGGRRRALPYHAGLDKAVRDANQDAFQQRTAW